MRVLVTGSRWWSDRKIIEIILDGFFVTTSQDLGEDMMVIDGGANGADMFAKHWRITNQHINHVTETADWDTHGKAAGPIRNRKMVDEHEPDVVLAFHDDLEGESKGTKDCVEYAKSKGIPVYNIRRL